jgi:hypothetical protein
MQQDISEASDEAAEKYFDETEEKDRDPAAMTLVMRAAAKTKAASYQDKFSKYTAVANHKLGDRFLEEVRFTLSSIQCLKFESLGSFTDNLL